MVLFDLFVPCVTGKTEFKDRLGGAQSERNLCTKTDEAFTILLVENSYERWVALFRE